MSSTNSSTPTPSEQPKEIRINPEQPLTQEQSLAILIQAVQVGQSKGIYNINEAELISKCVRKFTITENSSSNDTSSSNLDTVTI